MIYICADDYGLCEKTSNRIKQCVDECALNKVSVFPNFDRVNLGELLAKENVSVSLHLNLVEGRCLANSEEIKLITNEKGYFKHTFIGLLLNSLIRKKEFQSQIYKEIKAQVLFWKEALPENTPILIDSHQHTHMIPAIFKMLIKVLNEEKINVKYLRIPAEPISPYLKTPSLYFTYNFANIIKQWLLKFLWLFNKGKLNENIPTALFFGILFSGKMDEKRVKRILPEYIKLAKKKNKNIEVLLHPGFITNEEMKTEEAPIVFEKFYCSKNREIEFNTAMKINLKEA